MFTVVIPLYNKVSAITTTLKSVKEQTFGDFECLVVDDGSTDNSAEIVDEFINRGGDNRFHLIRKTNGGVSSARNVGIRLAKHPYIAFLDADDVWNKSYLDVVAYLIGTFPSCGIYGTGWCHSYNGDMNGITDIEIKRERTKCVQDTNGWPKKYVYTSSSSVVARDVFAQVGMFDERISIGEDLDMWYRILLAYSGAFYDDTLVYYRQDTENRLSDTIVEWEKHFVCYFDKWKQARDKNPAFRIYFDALVASRLFAFLERRNKIFREEVNAIRRQLDKEALSNKIILRLYFPVIFHIYWYIKHKLFGTLS